MFKIKICGITSIDNARMVVAAGADAIGLNFHPASPRHVVLPAAAAIAAALPPGIVKVGVFVNAAPAAVCQTFDALKLDLVQLHGDEPPGDLARLGGRPVMKAFRLGPAGIEPVAAYLEECRRYGCLPRLVLLDAHMPGSFGGTGQVADWAAAARYRAKLAGPPLALAGGLTPENVAAAIRATGACAVDTASGVEAQPGRKDPERVRAFILAAAAALKEAT